MGDDQLRQEIKLTRKALSETQLLLRIGMLRNAIVAHRKAMAEYRPAEYDSLLWKALDDDDTFMMEAWRQ